MAKKRKAEDTVGQGLDDDPQTTIDSGALDGKANRRKKSTQVRTLRACDRCQHRKLACDGALESCQQCQKANTWCTMTDPVTGVAYYRGQFEYLERRIEKQNREIKELLEKLRAIGHDVSSYGGSDKETERYEAWAKVQAVDDAKPWEREMRQPNRVRDDTGQVFQDGVNRSESGHGVTANQRDSAPGTSHLAGRPSSNPANGSMRNFVGVATNCVLSQTKPGMRLNILGWELDIANFTEEKDEEFEKLPDPDNPVYDRSYRSFVATAHGLQPKLQNVKLPSRQQAFNYALQQLHTLGAFVPVLHKPSLTELLTKVYDDRTFRPSVGEEVCMHMSFAIAYYQSAARNFHNKDYASFHGLSDRHYHYALGFWPQLMIGNTLEDMQALAMISAHTRTFPRPEVGWIVMSATFNRLIQLDYHRSASSEQAWVAEKSFLELEMRKRVFWSCLVLVASANGKLGRPMPLRWEDFDVEFPLAVNDEQLTATGLDESKNGPCHFLPAAESFRIEPIFSELYSTLYALRKSPQDPKQFVEKAEKRLQDWWDTRHPDLKEESSNPLMQVLSQYLRSWCMEYRLILYHPSLSFSKSHSFNESNLKKCMEAAKGLLSVVTVLKDFKTMDTTWYNCAVYILAIQTTLYGHYQFRDDLTGERMSQIRSDMDDWLSIMGDVGCLLGSGLRLKQTIGRQIEEGMAQLDQHLKQKTNAKAGAILVKQETSQSRKESVTSHSTQRQPAARKSSISNNEGYNRVPSDSPATVYGHDNEFIPNQATSSSRELPMAQYGYNNAAQVPFENSLATVYSNAQAMTMGNQILGSTQQAPYADHSAQHPSIGGVNGMYIADGTNNNSAYPDMQVYGGEDLSWYQYTKIIGASGMEPQDYQPATALLQLGGRPEDDGSYQSMAANGAFNAGNLNVAPSQAWPYMILEPHQDRPGEG